MAYSHNNLKGIHMSSTIRMNSPPNQSGSLNDKDLPGKQPEKRAERQKEDSAHKTDPIERSEKKAPEVGGHSGPRKS